MSIFRDQNLNDAYRHDSDANEPYPQLLLLQWDLTYHVYSIVAMDKDSNKEVICLCPLEGIIDVITKKWALLIINEIGNHKRIRYNDLMNELQL